MADESGKVSTGSVFLAGLAAGTTEAVLVVSPMDLIKIRLQVCLYMYIIIIMLYVSK
jgi:solute carrier family 25 citrate transporter 1